MYCMREGDAWWCVEDSTYSKMYRQVKSLKNDIELYKRNGKEYFINSEGNYEIREDEDE